MDNIPTEITPPVFIESPKADAAYGILLKSGKPLFEPTENTTPSPTLTSDSNSTTTN
jgi:hypothetical protein